MAAAWPKIEKPHLTHQPRLPLSTNRQPDSKSTTPEKEEFLEVPIIECPRDGRTPTLLSAIELEELQKEIQYLSYFWVDISRDWARGKLRYRDIKKIADIDQRVLRYLPYLSIALYVQNRQKGDIRNHRLYRLLGKYFRGDDAEQRRKSAQKERVERRSARKAAPASP